MSGILGVLRKDGKPVTAQTLAPIRRVMAKWGVDGDRIWHAGTVGFGHLNLQVTPESYDDCQPLTLANGAGLTITADARIDNRTELMDRLGVPHRMRATMPDSALILRAYERWGPSCVERLLGAFAFAIWDARSHTLVCGRDHIGFRPFLYMDTPRFFIFASDLKGLLAYPPVSQTLYKPLLAASLQQMTYTAEKRYTFYEGILKLPPAHRMTITGNKTRLDQYWIPENAPAVRMSSNEAYAQQLRELLVDAVRCRLRTTYPVGSHLSGGLDSSAVTVLAAQNLRERDQRLEAFSWSPPPERSTAMEDERRRGGRSA
jgi:asparagine synthase (glutamine-hydrolysing)